MSEPLYQFVIYWSPSDHPGVFIVRRWAIHPDVSEPVADRSYGIAASLEHARRLVPGGMVCLTRSDNDDPVIVETWI